jgi:hypothetical protein
MDRLPKGCLRLGPFALVAECEAQLLVGLRLVRPQAHQFPERCLRLRKLVLARSGAAQVQVGWRELRVVLGRLPIRLLRGGQVALAFEGAAQVERGFRGIGPDAQRLLEGRDGPVVVVLVAAEERPPVDLRLEGVGQQAERRAIFRLRLGRPFLPEQGDTQVQVRQAELGPQAQGRAQLPLGRGELSLVGQGRAQVVVRARVLRQLADRFPEMRLRLGRPAQLEQGHAQVETQRSALRPRRQGRAIIGHRFEGPRGLEPGQQLRQVKIDPQVAGVLRLHPLEHGHRQPQVATIGEHLGQEKHGGGRLGQGALVARQRFQSGPIAAIERCAEAIAPRVGVGPAGNGQEALPARQPAGPLRRHPIIQGGHEPVPNRQGHDTLGRLIRLEAVQVQSERLKGLPVGPVGFGHVHVPFPGHTPLQADLLEPGDQVHQGPPATHILFDPRLRLAASHQPLGPLDRRQRLQQLVAPQAGLRLLERLADLLPQRRLARRPVACHPAKDGGHSSYRREEEDGHEYQGCQRTLVAPGKLADPIPQRGRTGRHGLIAEVAGDVLGQAVGRLVAAGAVFLQALHHDPVQLTAHQPGQPARVQPPVGRDAR